MTAWDSLEHVPEPRRFAGTIVRLAKPGGHIAITTLNRRSAVAGVFRSRWSMVVEDHFTYWDRSSLSRLFASLGLVEERVETFGLGRDFVDAALRFRARLAIRHSDGTEFAPPPGEPEGAWDAARGVLALEDAINVLLRAADAGVGVAGLWRKPA